MATHPPAHLLTPHTHPGPPACAQQDCKDKWRNLCKHGHVQPHEIVEIEVGGWGAGLGG